MFAIASTMEWREIVDFPELELGLEDEQVRQLTRRAKDLPGSDLEKASAILSEPGSSLGVKKLGEVSEPVPAVIFLSPEEDDTDES